MRRQKNENQTAQNSKHQHVNVEQLYKLSSKKLRAESYTGLWYKNKIERFIPIKKWYLPN